MSAAPRVPPPRHSPGSLRGADPSTMTLTLTHDSKTLTVALRPDTAEYLLAADTLDPKDWRLKDLVLACWAVARQLR